VVIGLSGCTEILFSRIGVIPQQRYGDEYYPGDTDRDYALREFHHLDWVTCGANCDISDNYSRVEAEAQASGEPQGP
jgi:hypothetical protein